MRDSRPIMRSQGLLYRNRRRTEELYLFIWRPTFSMYRKTTYFTYDRRRLAVFDVFEVYSSPLSALDAVW